VAAVVDGQGGQRPLVDRRDPGATVAVGRGHQHRQGRPRAHDPDQPVHHRRVGVKQAAQQRTPGKVDGHQVGQAVQLRRQRLGGGHHEQRVRQATALGPAAGPARRLGHRRRAGVDPDDQPVHLGRRGQHEAAVAGPQVDGRRPVAGGKVMELADVHVLYAPAGNHPHHARPPTAAGAGPMAVSTIGLGVTAHFRAGGGRHGA
jgi:hypothetical protein